MIEVAAELDEIIALTTQLNGLRGISRRGSSLSEQETWHASREAIARGIARAVGKIRKELGITDTPLAFCAPQIDAGHRRIFVDGRQIPIERRRPR